MEIDLAQAHLVEISEITVSNFKVKFQWKDEPVVLSGVFDRIAGTFRLAPGDKGLIMHWTKKLPDIDATDTITKIEKMVGVAMVQDFPVI